MNIDRELVERMQALILYGDADNGQERLSVVMELRAAFAQKEEEPVAEVHEQAKR